MRRLCRQKAMLEEPVGEIDIHHKQTYSAPQNIMTRIARDVKQYQNNNGTTSTHDAIIWVYNRVPKQKSIISYETKKYKVMNIDEFVRRRGKVIGCLTRCSTHVLNQK